MEEDSQTGENSGYVSPRSAVNKGDSAGRCGPDLAKVGPSTGPSASAKLGNALSLCPHPWAPQPGFRRRVGAPRGAARKRYRVRCATPAGGRPLPPRADPAAIREAMEALDDGLPLEARMDLEGFSSSNYAVPPPPAPRNFGTSRGDRRRVTGPAATDWRRGEEPVCDRSSTAVAFPLSSPARPSANCSVRKHA